MFSVNCALLLRFYRAVGRCGSTALRPAAQTAAPQLSATIAPRMHYLLFYDFVSDYLERRPLYRARHLQLAWEAQTRGELVLAGALAEPSDAAVLVFQGESADVAERFAAADPYVQQGLVLRWRVRPWITVVGALAATPLRPQELSQ